MSGPWYRCNACQVFIKDLFKYKVHVDSHNDLSGIQDPVDLFITPSGSVCQLHELPESLDIYIPQILLTPLEDIHEDSLYLIHSPQIILERVDDENVSEVGKVPSEFLATKKQLSNSVGRNKGRRSRRGRLNLDVKEKTSKFRCSHCRSSLLTRSTLAAHIQLYHKMDRNYKCGKCAKKFATSRTLYKHQNRKECKGHKNFNVESQADLNGGKELKLFSTPSTEEVRSCPFCHRLLRSWNKRQDHFDVCKRRVKKKSGFPCLYSCPAKFETAEGLADHIRVFHKAKPLYNCEYCSKGCATFESLNRHMKRTCFAKIERGVVVKKVEKGPSLKQMPRILECHLCGKILGSHRGWKSHVDMRVCQGRHDPTTGEFKKHRTAKKICFCDVCNRSFTSYKYLRRHLRRKSCRKQVPPSGQNDAQQEETQIAIKTERV